jgi:hypothetical protein
VIKGSCGLNLLCHLSWSSETYLLVYGLVVDRYGTTRLRAVCRHLKVIHTMFQLFVSTQNSLLSWQDQKMGQFAFGMLQHTGETWTWSSQSSFWFFGWFSQFLIFRIAFSICPEVSFLVESKQCTCCTCRHEPCPCWFKLFRRLLMCTKFLSTGVGWRIHWTMVLNEFGPLVTLKAQTGKFASF